MSERPVGPRTLWALTYGAITVGAFAADVALTEAIDGAATLSEETVLWGSAALAVVALALGVTGYQRSQAAGATAQTHRSRGRLAFVTAFVAVVIGVSRTSILGGHLVRHIRLARDEPLTTAALALQIVVAITSAGALMTFAVRELLLARRFTAAAGDDPRTPPTRPDVGRTGRCPTN